MKLATVREVDGSLAFGFVAGEHLVPFAALALEDETLPHVLSHMSAYLDGLPVSRAVAEEVARRVTGGEGARLGRHLDVVDLAPTLVRPAALLDCGLTPRHLANSSAVLLRRSLPPGAGHLLGAVAQRVLRRSAGGVRYYKGNCQSVSGDGDTVPWPSFSAYLDIEPELALVTGAVPIGSDRAAAEAAIAGYTVFNDVSARDVQLGEMFFTGPATSKDLDMGNGLGPWLVTADEVGDPRSLAVRVETSGREAWGGTTAEYSMDPVDVVVALARRQSLAPGTVVGMGTVPDTCGLDRDEWLRPGDEVAITFERIGTLRQRLGVPDSPPRTRWAQRRDLGPVRRGA